MDQTAAPTLSRTLGGFHLWGITVGLVISGEYFGWSYGWTQAGTLGFLVYALALLRIMAGLVLMQHGLEKMFRYPDPGHSTGPYQILSLVGIAAVLELFGGAALVIGLAVPVVAFILSGQMAVAYFMFHFPAIYSMPRGFFPVVNGGDLAVVLCFTFLYLAAAGAGRWSVDELLDSRQGSG